MSFSDHSHDILKKYWGYDCFRPLQEDIILSVLEGKDTLALLPTGGGKSICFQVPAMVMEGICLVVSPLIALMKDQVDNLKQRRVKAAALYSGLTATEMDTVISNALYDKELKFLYVSPERLQSSTFQLQLKQMKIGLIAVDEAHCISQWGYDFRPPYLEIAAIRPFFPKVPILALTATATPEVVKDIQAKLLFKKENLFQKSFKRDNLTYFVVEETDKYNRLLRIMGRYPGTGIVYVRNRKKTKECADFLQRHHINADYYHAGLDTQERDLKQQDWKSGKTRVIVSTNAFGMGIDKPDVRFVVHLDIPDSLEAYFQEAGRGGRDELPAVAILLYDAGDIKALTDNFENSFPPLSGITTAYIQLCNYFKIAIGDGENARFVFDFDALTQHLALKPILFWTVLHFLENAGLVALSDDANKPSRLMVKMNDAEMDHFYQEQSAVLNNLFQTLLRSYSGLFTGFVHINEKEIAKRTEMEEEQVIKALTRWHQLGAINYIPSQHAPTIIFLQNRVKDQHVYITPKVYQQRKEAAQKRLEAVLDFIDSDKTCHSVALLQYFGEKKSSPCEQCDVCLQWHRIHPNVKEYEAIRKNVLLLQSQNKRNIKSIIYQLSQQFNQEKVIQVIRLMQDRNEI
ncbi:MAG: RecQ family ATP-dependent DNA helicase [Bacteroidales bacterium]|jgi:ATP-dependent DNA helicase RecQ|nr:RecQ family ATP-dependent DNA helicase [Bacteroidales bacterium]